MVVMPADCPGLETRTYERPQPCSAFPARCLAATCSARSPRSTAPRPSSNSPSTVPSAMPTRSEEHTSELQSLMRISYAVFCLKKKKIKKQKEHYNIKQNHKRHNTHYP